MNDKRFRNFFITINYKDGQGCEEDLQPFDRIRDFMLENMEECEYLALALERGEETNRLHYHLLIQFKNKQSFKQIREKTLERLDNEKVYGDIQRQIAKDSTKAIDYLKGEKAHEGKKDKLIQFFEQGTPKKQGSRTDFHEILEMVENGFSDYEIMKEYPAQYMRYSSAIGKMRLQIAQERGKKEWRDLEVTYLWGEQGSGKTRYVLEKYGYENVYSVDDYEKHPFDNYEMQDVILFDEFRSSLQISKMLKLLDGYPLKLRARYNNHQAVYTKVFIISNIPLEKQYINVQYDEPVTWKAFLRRIHHIKEMNKDIVTATKEIFGEDFNIV